MALHTKLLGAILLWHLADITPLISAIDKRELYELRHHFADDSFISRQYPCTDREAECFKENKLLYEGDGQCYTVREQGPCGRGEIFYADKAEATRLGGHLRGTCVNSCEDATRAPLAATGECLTESEVADKVCRKELYLAPARDAFGQWVCEWTRLPCSPPKFKRPSTYLKSNPTSGICSPPANIFRREGYNLSTNETSDDHPLLQFFTEEFDKEREFPCSEEEKDCLQYGRLLHTDGKCYRTGEFVNECENGRWLQLDRKVMKENGHLTGTCQSYCHSYLEEESNNCTSHRSLLKVCRWDWGMNPIYNEFGESVCYCLDEPRYTPIAQEPTATPLPPASKPGYCRMPDFSRPVFSPTLDNTLTLGFEGPCSVEEFTCLRKGQVLLDGECYSLRTRGPCAEDEQLVLDKEALAHAQIKPKCTSSSCPEGSVRMPIDGKCRTIKQASSLLCSNLHVILDKFGNWQCGAYEQWWGNLTSIIRHSNNGTCVLPRYDFFIGPPGSGLGDGKVISRLPSRVIKKTAATFVDSNTQVENENALEH